MNDPKTKSHFVFVHHLTEFELKLYLGLHSSDWTKYIKVVGRNQYANLRDKGLGVDHTPYYGENNLKI